MISAGSVCKCLKTGRTLRKATNCESFVFVSRLVKRSQPPYSRVLHPLVGENEWREGVRPQRKVNVETQEGRFGIDSKYIPNLEVLSKVSLVTD